MHVLCEAGQEYGGLAGGVPAANNRNLFVAAHSRFELRGSVVNAFPVEAISVFDAQSAIATARSDNDRPSLQDFAIVNSNSVRGVEAFETYSGTRDG